jgi:hypothetical protein
MPDEVSGRLGRYDWASLFLFFFPVAPTSLGLLAQVHMFGIVCRVSSSS